MTASMHMSILHYDILFILVMTKWLNIATRASVVMDAFHPSPPEAEGKQISVSSKPVGLHSYTVRFYLNNNNKYTQTEVKGIWLLSPSL